MTAQAHKRDPVVAPQVLSRAPADLTCRRLARLGEGINKVVYAADHWVIKRERRPAEILTLICVWKFLSSIERFLPGGFGLRILQNPGKQIRVLRIIFRALTLPVPRSIWLATHIGSLWRWHSSREARGGVLAGAYLSGTPLVPVSVTFPPTRIKVGAWPGWMIASEATERVEATLQDRLNELARARRFDEIELWLERFLDLRQAGWKRGVFSMDPHLKNFGIIRDRVVLLDPGGLTDAWAEIRDRLTAEDDFEKPHERLGLEMTLRDRPDIAQRFDNRWTAIVNADTVRSNWPADRRPGAVGVP